MSTAPSPASRIRHCFAAIAALGALVGSGAFADVFTGLSLRVLNESSPPGGTVQLKVTVTEPRPIILGSASISFGTSLGKVFGALMPGAPDSAGVAVIGDHQVAVRTVSPSGTLGMSTAAPAIVLTIEVPQTTPVGASAALALDPATSSWIGPFGNPYPQQVRNGQFVAGGTVSINDILPGGGFLPAGSVVTVVGSGFQPGVLAEIDGVAIASVTRVDSGRIDMVTAIGAQLDNRRVTVRNPDASRAAYFSYLRAAGVGTSARALLAATEAIYPVRPLSRATFNPPPPSPGTFFGVAIQNPNPSPSTVTFELWSENSLVAGTSFVLDSRSEIVREASELLSGVIPAAGGVLRIAASSPVQLLGLAANDNDGSVAPVLPLNPVP